MDDFSIKEDGKRFIAASTFANEIVEDDEEYKIGSCIDSILPLIPYYNNFELGKYFDIRTNALLDKRGNPTDSIFLVPIVRKTRKYLIDYGFASENTQNYLILTERGRWLKEQGSMEKYKEYQVEKRAAKQRELEDKAEKERLERELMKVSIEVSNSTKETNQSVRKTNRVSQFSNITTLVIVCVSLIVSIMQCSKNDPVKLDENQLKQLKKSLEQNKTNSSNIIDTVAKANPLPRK